jgi:hypothetical protein
MYQVSEGELPSALHLLLRLPVESSTILLGRAEQEVPGTMPPGQSDCPPSADRRTGGRAGLLTNDSACTTMCPRLNAGLFRHQSFNLAKARRGSRRRGRRSSIVVPTHTLYTIILLSWCVVGKDILLSIFNTQCRGKKRES